MKILNRFQKYLFILFLLLFPVTNVMAQQTVTGTVIDAQTGDPLIGANILIKGTSTGTATDKHGEYEISVPSLKNDTLVISYIGYTKKQIPIQGRKHIIIKLKSKTTEAEQLVVTAYGSEQEKQDIVGAVTTLSHQQLQVLKTSPSANLTASLAGRIPGLIAFQRSGEPGQNNAQFFIRGVTSFGFDTNPLILIDNVKSTPDQLAHLNPNDIASFSILKDATATSLYGSEAANGVLLITTKTGHVSPLRVDIRVANTISTPTQVPKFADPITYMKEANNTTISRNPLKPLPYTKRKIDKTKEGVNPFLFPAVNWRKQLFKNYTMNRRFDLNLSGGGKTAQYYVSGSYTKETGLLKVPHLTNFNNNIDVKNYSLRSNINVNLTKSTELKMKISGLFDNYHGPLQGGKEVYHEVVNANPVHFPAKFPVDSAYSYVDHPLFGGYQQGQTPNNPYAEMVRGYKHYARSTINAQFGLDQNLSFFIKGLELHGLVNIQRFSYTTETRAYNPFYYKAVPLGTGVNAAKSYTLRLLNPKGGTNYLDYSPGSRTVTSRLYVQGRANYDRTFGKKHGLSGLFVFTARNQTYDNVNNLEASLPHRNVNLAARLTYNYNHIYYAEFNFGLNASERFAKNHRWGFFPSVGVAWNISNQKFWKPLKDIVTRFKIKATYGLSGNDQIGSRKHRFLYLSKVDMNDSDYSFVTGSNNGFSLNGISISQYSNPSITWERSKKLNLGVRLGLLNSLTVKANFYYQHRSNILQERVDLPSTMGLATTPSANTGEAKSHGFDSRIVYHLYPNNNWSLTVRGNFTYATSEYVKYSEPFFPNAPNRSHIGLPIGTKFGLYAERLFMDKQDVENSPPQSFGLYGAGDIKYLDVNGDGKITNLDLVPMGYPTVPEINYGFGFSLGYKDFDLSAFFEGLARESFWINVSSNSSISNQGTAPFVGGHQVLKVYTNNHWSPNDPNLYALYPHFSTPRANGIGASNNAKRSTWFMRSGAFLRVKEIQIGYSLPEEIISKLSLRKVRFYINSRNLAHFSPFKLWDPEMAGDGLGYPLQRTYNIGINIKF